MRINKYIARSGFCSRREADKLITAGEVRVNDVITTKLSATIQDNDKVTIRNKLIKHQQTELYAFYKPKSCLTSKSDPQKRKLIYDHLPKSLHELKPIGRLDFNSEGLLLLTNDGELKRKYELPENKFIRTYRVRFFGNLTEANIKRIKAGIKIENIKYKILDIKIEKADNKGNNKWCLVSLAEGKNREIRRIFTHFNLSVNRLIRISYGPHKLNGLKAGEFIKL